MVETPYWKTGEVLAYFKISRETLRRWRKKRGFPEPIHFRDDGRDPAYYPIVEVLEWDRRRRRGHQTRPIPSVLEGASPPAE